MKRRFIRHKWRQFKALKRRQQLIVLAVPAALLLLITPLLTYAYFARDIANRERLMNRNNTGIVLLDRHGADFYSFGKTKNQATVPLSQIPDTLEKGLIATEDKDFYEHPGFSFRRIAAALYSNILNRDATRYGGSTLTQQLVKNTLLSSRKNFLRKYQEFSLAIAVERKYSKDEILEMYLNSVYYGEGAFGIEDAAKIYYGKTPQDLNLAETSMLIAILPAPSAFSPITGDADEAKKRQERVLTNMVGSKEITDVQKTAALATQLNFAAAVERQAKAPHFAEMVLNELYERYGEEQITRSGYRVSTSLDLGWQAHAEQTITDRMPSIQRSGGSNAGLVAIDPKNGEVRALVGSADWNNEKFGKVNMAITARQPGSSFKPIYYTEAIDKKVITAATIIRDEPTSFGNYKPENFDFRYRGDITVRNAIAASLNIPSVKIMEKLGVEEAVTTAQRMGISTVKDPSNYGLSLALGAAETKLMDMTNAYAAFANNGDQFEPTIIVSIKNKFDKTIHSNKQRSKNVVNPNAAFIISDILSDNAARSPTFGSSLNISGRQVAVKTGSTDDNRDAWTIGYTPSIVVGVWAGNNDNAKMSAGGSGTAGPIWRLSMQKFLADTQPEKFTAPGGVEKVLICRANGFRAEQPGAGVYSEYFIRGTTPAGKCNETRKEEKKEEVKKPEEDEEQPDQDNNNGNDNNDEEDEVTPTPQPTPTPTPTPGPPTPTPTPPPPAPTPTPGPPTPPPATP